ncbi:MAG: TolC family protein [Brumimicrobium sp.]
MNKLVGLLVLSALSFSVSAQEFSLFEAQTHALENAEDIKVSELDYESAEKQVVETRSIGLPQINSEMSFQNFLNIPVQVVDGEFIGQPGTLVSFRAGTDYSTSAGVTVNQLIFDGSYIVGLKVSNFYKEFVSTNIKRSQQEVLFDVTRAYEMTLISKRNKEFIDTLVELTEDLKDKQTQLFEVGLIPQEEIDQTNYSLLTAKTNQTAARLSYQNAQTLLKMTMAYPIDSEIELTDDLDKLLEEQLTDLSGQIEDNLTLELLQKQKVLSEYDLKNIKMKSLPRLSSFFNHQYNAYRNDFTFFDSNEEWFEQTAWGLNLTIPIFASGDRWAKTQKAKIAVKQDEYEIQKLERSLQAQEVQLTNNLTSARQNLELQGENIKLARKIYDNSLLKAEIGKENSILVTQKYNQLISAQSQYVNAMMDVFNAKLELDQLYNKINRK